MKHAQPRRLSRRRVERLLSRTKSCDSAGGRIEIFSRHFIGQPYLSNLLIGSAERPEVFTVSLDAFDCVTYIETTLALSLARNSDEFLQWLRRIRYENGSVDWERRNHYMTDWIRRNMRSGALRRMSMAGIPVVEKSRVLDVVPGLPPVRARFSCVPRPAMGKLVRRIKTGDLIFFASTRSHLDVFHCGIVIKDADGVLVRHASRSRGGVVEQSLDEFLKANRMAGVIIARPRERTF
jgi:hypothetical protein